MAQHPTVIIREADDPVTDSAYCMPTAHDSGIDARLPFERSAEWRYRPPAGRRRIEVCDEKTVPCRGLRDPGASPAPPSPRAIRPARSPSSCPTAPAARSTSWRARLSEAMRASLGQPIVIENVTGANGTIGVGRAVHAAPDGYTVSIGNWPSHITNGAIYNLNYDIQKDLVPVARLPQNPYIAVVRKDFPAKDFKELIAWLKANPDKATRAPRASAPASTSAASISRRSPAPNSSSCRTSPAPPTSSATSPPATSTSPSIRRSPRCRTSRAAT